MELDLWGTSGEVRLNGNTKGASPREEPTREQQAFEAWREELSEEERLLEAIVHPYYFQEACRRVKSNKGAAGVDGMSVDELEQWLETNATELKEQLLHGRYRPQAVKGVSIPKPNGGTRQLGIPTVIDRVVQQSMVMVLTPILDPQMSESSYGFRPRRSAHQALKAGSAYVEQGYKVAVDLDLEKFFDQVNHDILMSRLARRIRDKRVLYYIRLMLKAGMMNIEGIKQKREQGTPQGGPLSPLLANVLLDDLDRELESRGLRFCRYADDCIIFVKTKEAGQRVLTSITRYIERTLKLKVNEQKSKVDMVSNCVYLGYIIGNKGRLRIAPESVKKFKARIKRETRRTQAAKLSEVIKRIVPIMRGWANYYKLAAIKTLSQKLDQWIRRRLRCLRLKQCKTARRIREFLTELEAHKKSKWNLWFWAGVTVNRWWKHSGEDPANTAMSNKWFREQGYIALTTLLKS